MPEFRTIDAGQAQLRVAIKGDGPLVVLVHGFPESWYSWRHQLSPIAAEMRRLLADPAEIDRMLAAGAERASTIAEKTMNEVRDIVGLIRG